MWGRSDVAIVLARLAIALAIIILLLVVAFASRAMADNGTPSRDRFWRPSDGWQRDVTHRPHRRPVTRKMHKGPKGAQRHKSTRVRAWRHVAPSIPAGCLGPIEAYGDQRPTLEGARKESVHAWMTAVRARWGESYMMPEHSQNAQEQCFTSSIPNAMTRGLDAVKQVVTGEEAGLLKRCRRVALACRAPLEAAR